MKKTVLVKVDLLLHEDQFTALRDFMQDLDISTLKPNDCIEYSMENDCIIINPLVPDDRFVRLGTSEMLIHDKVTSGEYILLTVGTLKNLISQ